MTEELVPGEVISHHDMCSAVGVSLQKGMNFRLRGGPILLMSRRRGAPYDDHVDESGETLIYEGHDCSRTADCPLPKRIDQPERSPKGTLTENGLFAAAARDHTKDGLPPAKVRVFEKIRAGIWVYNGIFDLVDSWIDDSSGRRVFKFKLKLVHAICPFSTVQSSAQEQEDDRIIPSWVKQAVWKRDKGKCRECGASTSLHFDHIIPFSKGGSSKDPKNIQILCGRHNLAKHNKIE